MSVLVRLRKPGLVERQIVNKVYYVVEAANYLAPSCARYAIRCTFSHFIFQINVESRLWCFYFVDEVTN